MRVGVCFVTGPLAGQRFLISDMARIGRQASNDLPVDDLSVSSYHGVIYFHEGRPCIQDNDSTNGTTVNGRAVTSAFLSDGDVVALGDVTFQIGLEPDAPAVAAAPTEAEQPAAPVSESPKAESAHIEPPYIEPAEPRPVAPPGQSSPEVNITIIPAHPGQDVEHPSRRERGPAAGSTRVLDRGARPGPRRRRRSSAFWAAAAVVVAMVVAGIGLGRGCSRGPLAGSALLSAEAREAAVRSLARDGVRLTIQEPVGLARKGEPVTSGVPLPEGSVKDVGELRLLGPDGKPTPCQFTVLSRWPYSAQGATKGKPDGSVKWCLLDFQADVGASQKVEYVLCRKGGAIRPIDPLRVVSVGDGLKLETLRPGSGQAGNLRLGISSNAPGLLHELEVDGRVLVSRENPLQTTLVDASNRVYRASKPDAVVVEVVGPMRTTVRVSGHYVSEDGGKIFGGKVGYDVRFTAYAGRSDVRVDFTFKNDGWYGYRNEGKGHPRQWLYFRELRLDVPVGANMDLTARFGDGPDLACGATQTGFTQWYKYPYRDARGFRDVYYTNAPLHEAAAGMSAARQGYYRVWSTNGVAWGQPGAVAGVATLSSGGEPLISMVARRFKENHPAGFSAACGGPDGRPILTFHMLPLGGCWPRTAEAFHAQTYQFEGGRRKTWTISLERGSSAGGPDERRLAYPLFALAPAGWYRDTGAVLPLGGLGVGGAGDSELAEAAGRYDRLQRAKVRLEVGDPAGLFNGETEDRWGAVSIPSLWERCPDVFAGWMNYGDLVWTFGYCSLYYGWPYSMLSQYLRLGDPEFLAVGEEMIRHRYDIDQYHVEKSQPWLAGFQRNERGEHGHISRQEASEGRNKHWESNARPSHSWNRDLLLHWALTGDPRSLEAARQNGRAFRRFFYAQQKLGEKDKLPWGEFRVPVWAMDNWLALYEYTGQADCLGWAGEVFDKTLLAMERDNGSQGHILKDGKQGAQFVGYMVEPVCRLQHHTGRADVGEFLRRVLDWQREKGTVRGETKDGVYYPLMWREEWDYEPEPGETISIGVAHHYNFMLCDGYAYLHRLYGRAEDLEFGRRLFRDILFYTTMCEVRDGGRSPLGYHHLGDPFGFTPKIHAWSGRYAQLYLQVEEDPAPCADDKGRQPVRAGVGF